MIWTPVERYEDEPFESETDLEEAILEVANPLFGVDRIYLDVKKLIGVKSGTKNIPDGYLLDLASKTEPRLFVIENELASHEPIRHVAVQILEFSLSFSSSPLKVKTIIKDAISARIEIRQFCADYAKNNGFENLDVLLEKLVNAEDGFRPLVIIDDLEEELEKVLFNSFRFPVETLTLKRFRSEKGERAYQFEPFLSELTGITDTGLAKPKQIDLSEVDTIVVPAQDEGFEETFLKESCWHHIRIDASMIPKIKYLAIYRVDPISAVTHLAKVDDIKLWKDTSKYILQLSDIKAIGPLKLVPKSEVRALQSPRYTSLQKLTNARNLDEAF